MYLIECPSFVNITKEVLGIHIETHVPLFMVNGDTAPSGRSLTFTAFTQSWAVVTFSICRASRDGKRLTSRYTKYLEFLQGGSENNENETIEREVQYCNMNLF